MITMKRNVINNEIFALEEPLVFPILNFFSVIACHSFLAVVPRFGVSSRGHEQFCGIVRDTLVKYHNSETDESSLRDVLLKLPPHGGLWEHKWRKSRYQIPFRRILYIILLFSSIVGIAIIFILVPDEFVFSSLSGYACIIFSILFLESTFGIFDDLDYGKDVFCISRKFMTFAFICNESANGCYQFELSQVCAFLHTGEVDDRINFSSTERHLVTLLDMKSGITLAQVRSCNASEQLVETLGEYLQSCHKDLYNITKERTERQSLSEHGSTAEHFQE